MISFDSWGKRLVDIDEKALVAARAELGTKTLKDTVNEALRRAARSRDRRVTRALAMLAPPRLGDGAAHGGDAPGRHQRPDSRGPGVRTVVEPLAILGQVARAGICDLEVGFSARNAREWGRLASVARGLPLVETDAAHLRRALQVQRLLAAGSLRGRKVPDLLIAAAAEETG